MIPRPELNDPQIGPQKNFANDPEPQMILHVPVCRVWQVHARDISRKLKEKGAKKASARARSRRVLPYSANWSMWTANDPAGSLVVMPQIVILFLNAKIT